MGKLLTCIQDVLFRIPARVLSILTEVFRDFPPFLQVKAGVYFKSDNAAYFHTLSSSLAASHPAN